MAKNLPTTTSRCGAKTRSGHACKQAAGMGTDHVGVGRCKYHGGASPIKSGRYSKIQREDLAEAIERFQADPDPLNVEPELAMLRGILEGFINRYDELIEALDNWNAEYASGEDSVRPQRIPELREVAGLLDTVSKIVSRIEKVRSDSAISRKDLFRLISEYARIVDARVADDEVKEQIKNDWLQVRLA